MAQFWTHNSGTVKSTEINLYRLTQNPEPDFRAKFGLFTMLGSKFTKFAFFCEDTGLRSASLRSGSPMEESQSIDAYIEET